MKYDSEHCDSTAVSIPRGSARARECHSLNERECPAKSLTKSCMLLVEYESGMWCVLMMMGRRSDMAIVLVCVDESKGEFRGCPYR